MPIFQVLIIGSILAAIAWVAESAVGVAEESHRAVDDIIFAIPLFVVILLTVSTSGCRGQGLALRVEALAVVVVIFSLSAPGDAVFRA